MGISWISIPPKTSATECNQAWLGCVRKLTEAEITGTRLTWHRLQPYDDMTVGLALLREKFRISMQSNGHPGLPGALQTSVSRTSRAISASELGVWRPPPFAYHEAADKAGLPTGECALVSVHRVDLFAVKAQVFRAIYVSRQVEATFPANAVELALVSPYSMLRSLG